MPEATATSTQAYAVDGLAPHVVLRPASVEELSSVLKMLHAGGQAAIPWGGGTRMSVGNMPERYHAALDLTGLAGNVTHEPGDLTVVADAGVRVADMSARLAKSNQRLPFDVPQAEKATVGGSVASNAAGFMRSSAGGIRDWIIGMKVVLADGTVTKSGGRVVKNVQGYDMHRLHTGAFGTLGVIAEVAFKLTPVPAKTRTIAAGFDELGHAAQAATALFNGAFTPESMSLFYGEGAAKAAGTRIPKGVAGPCRILLLTRVSGGDAAVGRQADETVKAARSAGAIAAEMFEGAEADSLWRTTDASPAGVTVSARSTLRPGNALKALQDLDIALSSWPTLVLTARVDCGFGTLITNWWGRSNEDAREAVGASVQAAQRNGGATVIEVSPSGIKRGMDVFGDVGPSLSVMRRMKEQYDPARILNPGRFAGGI